TVKGDKLAYDAPKGVMTPALLDLIKKHKAEIITLLAESPASDDEIPRCSEGSLCKVSQQQKCLYLVDQWQPGDLAYNEALALRFCGELNEAILARTLNELLHRHDSLRTTFVMH